MWKLFAIAVVLAAGCRLRLEDPEEQKDCEILTVDVCANQAPMHSDFDWIARNILAKNCAGTACHTRNSTVQKAKTQIFDETPETAYATLVAGPDGKGMGVGSNFQVVSDVVGNGDIPLVQPGVPDQSYLFYLMKGVTGPNFTPTLPKAPPDDVGWMPRGSKDSLCCQKLDAVQRWIEAGANFDGP